MPIDHINDIRLRFHVQQLHNVVFRELKENITLEERREKSKNASQIEEKKNNSHHASYSEKPREFKVQICQTSVKQILLNCSRHCLSIRTK